MRRLLAKFRVVGDVGDIWSGLVVLAAAAVAVLKAFEAFPWVADAATYIAILACGLLAGLAPQLLMRIRDQAQQIPDPNPGIEIEKVEARATIGQHSRSALRRTFVRAKQRTERYEFPFRITGSGTARVTLVNQEIGELYGPILRHDNEWYQVLFKHGLEAGATTMIEIRFDVEDPRGDMKPFVGVLIHEASASAELTHTISFSDGAAPVSVYSEVQHPMTGQPHRATRPLYRAQNGEYTERCEVHRNRVYVIGWNLS